MDELELKLYVEDVKSVIELTAKVWPTLHDFGEISIKDELYGKKFVKTITKNYRNLFSNKYNKLSKAEIDAIVAAAISEYRG